MNDENDLLKKISKAISAGLPGETAHFRMAPPTRAKLMAQQANLPEARKAAVLIPIYLDEAGIPSLLLTLRKTYEGVHSGQVSFPGGKFEPGETDPVQVALRESWEEIGLAVHQVEIAGLLSPLYIPPSHMHVQPVVGLITERVKFKPQQLEVERILFTEIGSLLSSGAVQQKEIMLSSNQKMNTPYFEIDGETVWGATAMILGELLEVWKRVK
jgi:8-oxo-dGTP pyrophosphatase MutT (NUDIX family)